MGNAVDFQKVRKRRQRIQTLKRLMVLVGIVALLGLVILLNSLFIEEGVTTRIGDFIESFGGTGYPIATPGGIIRDVKTVGNNLAVLNDTNLYLYNKKGKRVNNLQQMTDNTVLLTNSTRTLTYNIGGKTFAIHSATKELHSREEDDTITGGALGENDTYAIVTAPKQYVARVTVYNKQFSWIYQWDSVENHVSGVAISPRGNSMAVSTVNTNGGVMESSLRFFRFNSEEDLIVPFYGELILYTQYQSENLVAVLTDQSYKLVDLTGKVTGEYSLENVPISQIETSGNLALLLTEQKETRTDHIILLDGKAAETAQLTTANNVRDMALGSRRVYILTDQGIDVYSHTLELQESLEQRGILRIHLVGGRLYYFTAEEICLLDDSLAAASRAAVEGENPAPPPDKEPQALPNSSSPGSGDPETDSANSEEPADSGDSDEDPADSGDSEAETSGPSGDDSPEDPPADSGGLTTLPEELLPDEDAAGDPEDDPATDA